MTLRLFLNGSLKQLGVVINIDNCNHNVFVCEMDIDSVLITTAGLFCTEEFVLEYLSAVHKYLLVMSVFQFNNP